VNGENGAAAKRQEPNFAAAKIPIKLEIFFSKLKENQFY
jgi:hypothetical protein